MDIRKISIGPDYKSGAMHYIVGQEVLNGSYKIHLIKNYSNVVCLHMRLGDHKYSKNLKVFSEIKLDYYLNAR